MLTEASQKINGADKEQLTTHGVVNVFIRQPGGFQEITLPCALNRIPAWATPTTTANRQMPRSAEPAPQVVTKLIRLSLLGSFPIFRNDCPFHRADDIHQHHLRPGRPIGMRAQPSRSVRSARINRDNPCV